MPNQPCSGVEVWQRGRCGGEAAWDASLKRYTDAGGKVADYFGYVVSVNSMEKRSQHQVYGKSSLPPSDATIKNSMGVVASANNEWLILTLLRGAAECLLESESGPKSSTLITC
ncbi:hypothetical protein OEZ85_009182 [Tetradesmus obliquus]|uniref:Uncharacterized protein n=1 Tax=Tetradesmus obliquus TaxID=3088 RepID=A0ABY8TLE3_TETOB|nr:hypothetical protein OEZ85_009182 [Tetradesmus obliquus]